MDIKAYYRRIREVEYSLADEFPVTVTLATEDGGKPGVFAESPRFQAALNIACGRARLATEDEAAAFREQNRSAAERAREDEASRRVEVTVVSAKDLAELRKGGK